MEVSIWLTIAAEVEPVRLRVGRSRVGHLAKHRWIIERNEQELKQELGNQPLYDKAGEGNRIPRLITTFQPFSGEGTSGHSLTVRPGEPVGQSSN